MSYEAQCKRVFFWMIYLFFVWNLFRSSTYFFIQPPNSALVKPFSKTPFNPVRKSKIPRTFLGSGVSSKELAIFTRQLSTMLSAGLPLVRSLAVLLRQQKNKIFKSVIEELLELVESGNPLSEGLSLHPKIFKELYCHMVRAGEASGMLDKVLERLAGFMEKTLKVQGKVLVAMIYPALVLALSMTILGFLLVFVVPRFQTIYDSFLRGASLPPLTQTLINVSSFVQGNILIILGGLVLVFIVYRVLGASRNGRLMIDSMSLKIPVFGELLQKSALSRFARTFSTLLGSAVPLLDSLEISSAVAGNRIYQKELRLVRERVRDGESVSVPLIHSKYFPDMLTSLLEVGEETGQVPSMLNKIADIYEDELDNSLAAITSMLEPVMVIVLAVMVGTMVVALFLPLIGIFESLGG